MEASTWRRWYPVTLLLVVATIGVYVAQVWLGGGLSAMMRLGALRPDRVGEFHEYFRLVMPMFVHSSVWHLGLNLVALVQLGVLSEEFFGARRTLVTYVWCGIGGLLASAWFTWLPYPSAVGASGAVLGLAGLLLGSMWFGAAAVRTELAELLGRLLTLSVFVTFAFSIGMWFVEGGVDNWAHFGGFACGVMFAFVWSDPEVGGEDDDDEPAEVVAPATPSAPPTLVALLTIGVLVGAAGWMGVSGDRALPTLAIDTARGYATRVSMQPGAWENGDLLVQMLDRYAQAGAEAEGLDAFTRGVREMDSPILLQSLAYAVAAQPRTGRSHDGELRIVGERWLELAPTDPDAGNFVAWQLVIARSPEVRDPVRAEALASMALAQLPGDAPTSWSSGWLTVDPRPARAVTLDTRAEARFQLRRYAEALVDQDEATALARTLELAELTQFEERLTKINQALDPR